jgi:uncharacterized protein YjbI with pentapeptide repeats
MKPGELAKMLEAHRLWQKSGGREGQRANREHADLHETSDLAGASLQGAILNGANFTKSDLTDTDLQGAELRRANFICAGLRRTNLREADLQNADLETADFLLTSQLAGANVAGAKLPQAIGDFEGLEAITEATSNAQKVFVAMLGGCLYSWLTIGTTKDVALLTNSASSPLPIISTALPIVGFYLVAPVILLAIYFYFHLNMQRLWEALADLPAVFPDGRSLDKRADPWLLNGLVSAHFVRLRGERPALSGLQQLLSILLAWWVVPVTLFGFWGRFLMRHDWLGTDLHVGLLAVAIGFGWMSYRLARATLRGTPHKQFVWAQVWKDPRTTKRVGGLLATCGVGMIFWLLSLGAIAGVPSYVKTPNLGTWKLRRLVPHSLEAIGFSPFAKLVDEDVSIKSPNWSGKTEQYYHLVKGARLADSRMQYADAYAAFLVNADLRHAILSHAILSSANLFHANLSHAKLISADLDGADLRNANLEDADFSGANLLTTNLKGVDLRQVKGLSKIQLEQSVTDGETHVPGNLQ